MGSPSADGISVMALMIALIRLSTNNMLIAPLNTPSDIPLYQNTVA
jgi:hypothetical protein